MVWFSRSRKSHPSTPSFLQLSTGTISCSAEYWCNCSAMRFPQLNKYWRPEAGPPVLVVILSLGWASVKGDGVSSASVG